MQTEALAAKEAEPDSRFIFAVLEKFSDEIIPVSQMIDTEIEKVMEI